MKLERGIGLKTGKIGPWPVMYGKNEQNTPGSQVKKVLTERREDQ